MIFYLFPWHQYCYLFYILWQVHQYSGLGIKGESSERSACHQEKRGGTFKEQPSPGEPEG
jgi:hypothetical protein